MSGLVDYYFVISFDKIKNRWVVDARQKMRNIVNSYDKKSEHKSVSAKCFRCEDDNIEMALKDCIKEIRFQKLKDEV